MHNNSIAGKGECDNDFNSKKEFKDSVKEVMVDAVKNSRMPELTEKEKVSGDREIIRTLSRFYEEVVKELFDKQEEWLYDKKELFELATDILDYNIEQNKDPIVILESMMCLGSLAVLYNIIEKNHREKDIEEFDVEEILKEAKGCE